MRFLWMLLVCGLFSSNSFSQKPTFNFYGNKVQTYYLSRIEFDSLVKYEKVSPSLKKYIDLNIERFQLEDWGVVLLLNKFVSAAFSNKGESYKCKALSTLMTSQGISNAIGRKWGHSTSLISIDSKVVLEGMPVFSYVGFKLISIPKDYRTFSKLWSIDIMNYKGRDLSMKARAPQLNSSKVLSAKRFFQNFITEERDSIYFKYSPAYIKYAKHFPLITSPVEYSKLPISQVFINSLFEGLSPKLGVCKSKEDSINFLMTFTQTVIKHHLRHGITYAPENALVKGKGDCSEYTIFLSFLLSYYFRDLDMVFLIYDELEHVQLGIYNKDLDVTDKSYIEFQGKKYLVAEASEEAELGAPEYTPGKRKPRIIE